MSKKKPKEDPSQAPKGNAQVGDKVLIRWKHKGPWIETEITRIGLLSEHGYYFDIMVKYGNGRQRQISPFGEHPWPQIRIVPPEKELPQELRDWLAKHPDVQVVRYVCNSDVFRYRFMGPDGDEVCIRQETVEYADLEYNPEYGGWSNGKWGVDSCGLELGYDDTQLEMPEFDIQF